MFADVLIISASPREGGNSDIVSDYLAGKFEEFGLNARVIRLRDYRIEPCRSCRRCVERGSCVIDDDMKTLYDLLLGCRALVVVTPVYFNNVPSALKAFIDRTWPLRGRLRDKVGAVVVVGRRYGHELAVSAVISFFLKHEMVVGFRGVCLFAYERGDVLRDLEGRRDLDRLVRRVKELIGRLSAKP